MTFTPPPPLPTDGTSLHVTVPDQPAACFSEAILKTTTPLKVSVISSFNGDTVMTIPFSRIRRFGCQLAIDKDIIWFETCGCKGDLEEFQFFIVALGIEKAYQVVQEYKRSIELALRDHMIMEEGDQTQFLYSYVVKSHYGHSDFPAIQRERILQSSILSLSTSGGSMSLSELNKFTRSRPSFPAISPLTVDGGGVSPGRGVSPSSPISPTHYSHGPPGEQSGAAPGGKMTLGQLQRSPRPSRSSVQSSMQSSAPLEFDSGVSVDGPVDPSRHSAPCYVFGSEQNAQRPKLRAKGKSFDGMRKISAGSSFDQPRKTSAGSARPTLQDIRESGKGETTRLNVSLGQLQLKGGLQAFNAGHRGTDSALGSASDLNHTPYSKAGGNPYAYDHLGNGKSNGAYAFDHLDKVLVTPPTPLEQGRPTL